MPSMNDLSFTTMMIIGVFFSLIRYFYWFLMLIFALSAMTIAKMIAKIIYRGDFFHCKYDKDENDHSDRAVRDSS